MATLETEIRKLQPVELFTLAQILNNQDCWKKLMVAIPKEGKENEYMFNNEHIAMIEQATRQQQRSAAEIFLSEWSTLNKNRPTCHYMLELLKKVELFRAADYLAVEILKGDRAERPKFGPAATVDVSDKVLEEILKQQARNAGLVEEAVVGPRISYSMHYEEKPANTVADPAPKSNENSIQSDLMKFSETNNIYPQNLMKFSESNENQIENLSKQVSDMIKTNKDDICDSKEEQYDLQEVQSDDIPICVKESMNNSDKSITSMEYLKNAISLNSISEIEKSVESNDLESSVPVVVFENTEKM